MKRLLTVILALSLACLGRQRGGSATGQVILPQTAVAAETLEVRVIDGSLGFSCASSNDRLLGAPTLALTTFDLDARTGRIDDIPAGDNRIFFFVARAGVRPVVNVAIGCVDNIRINAGEVRQLGTIILKTAEGLTPTYELNPGAASVGSSVSLNGQGFPNDIECVEVFFTGRTIDGQTTKVKGFPAEATPIELEVPVPLGAVSGPVELRILAVCAQGASDIVVPSPTELLVIPSIRSVVYSKNHCGADEAEGARAGDVVELRGTGFSPVAAENRVQITGFAALRAVWAAPAQQVTEGTFDVVRFVAPRGLPAGRVPLAVSVEIEGAQNPPLSPSISFRSLPTLVEITPPFAPAQSAIVVEVAGARSTGSDNLIQFIKGSSTVQTFPTLVSGERMAVLVPNEVSAGDVTLQVDVDSECSNSLSFFRAHHETANPVALSEAPGLAATLEASPGGKHVAGVLAGTGSRAVVRAVGMNGGAAAEFPLPKGKGPVFTPNSSAVHFFNGDSGALERVLLDAALTRSSVPLSPPANNVSATARMVGRGSRVYLLTKGLTDDVIEVDVATGQTRQLLGSGACKLPTGLPIQLLGASDLFVAPIADLIVVTTDAGPPLLLFGSATSCTADFLSAVVEPTIAFHPGQFGIAYFAPVGGGRLRVATIQRGTDSSTIVESQLPAELPVNVLRMMVTPSGARLIGFGSRDGNRISRDILREKSVLSDFFAVDLLQGGTTIPLTQAARQSFGNVYVPSVRVSRDSRTLYVPSGQPEDGSTPSPGGANAGASSLSYVDLDSFLSDTQGTGIGISKVTYGAPGTTRTSALGPDGQLLHLLVEDQVGSPVPTKVGKLYTFKQRPQRPFRSQLFADFFYSSAQLTMDGKKLVTAIQLPNDAAIRVFDVDSGLGSWRFNGGSELLLPGYKGLTRVFTSPTHDVAIVAETLGAGAVGDVRRACILRNLTLGPPTECEPLAGVRDVQRVEFQGDRAVLHAFGATKVFVVQLVGAPLVSEHMLTRAVHELFVAADLNRALVLHRGLTPGSPNEVSLLNIQTGQLIETETLSGTPGLAALGPARRRLLVPMVDSPFVDVVLIDGDELEVRRMATFGGIHVAGTFFDRPTAEPPAPRLSAYAFDVLQDSLTRFVFSDDTELGGFKLPGLAVATGTVPIDRSNRAGLTEADIDLIETTVGTRHPPGIISPDGRTLWLSTAERPEVVMFDLESGSVLSRVPLPGSFAQPRQLLATPDGRWVVVRDMFLGMLQMIDVAGVTTGSQ